MIKRGGKEEDNGDRRIKGGDWRRMKGEKEEDERWWEGRSEDTRRKKRGA